MDPNNQNNLNAQPVVPVPPTEPVQPAQPVQQPTPALASKKNSKLLLIILAVILIAGGVFAGLFFSGVISFDGSGYDSGGSGGSGGRNLSVPTVAKMTETCEAAGNEMQERESHMPAVFREAQINAEMKDYYCSNGVQVTISNVEYTELLAEMIKREPKYAEIISTRPSGVAPLVSALYSSSSRNVDGTIEIKQYTFSALVDEENYYKAKMGINDVYDEEGQNSGYLIVYKNIILITRGDVSEDFIKQLGVNV